MMVEKQGYNQVITFAGLVSFTRGALNGTRSLTTKNFTLCENRLITKVDQNAQKMWNYTLDGQLFKVGWSLLDMMYNVDPITQACYKGFKEVGASTYNNALLLTPRVFLDNIIFNFGNIFDSIRDVLLFFTDDDRGEYDLPYDAGYGLGNAVYLVFKPKV